jgi:hypothetical protein
MMQYARTCFFRFLLFFYFEKFQKQNGQKLGCNNFDDETKQTNKQQQQQPLSR